MRMLDRKLTRDFARLWAQIIAVALVMACGVATIVIAIGAYRSLDESRSAFYDRYRFADVFAGATRAPDYLKDRILGIDGVARAELRIVRPVLLDMEAMSEPATGTVISIPDFGQPSVNRLYVRTGRLPAPDRDGEVAVNESFAKAHRMVPGSRFRAIMDGHKRLLTVTGIVLSPEYVYAIGPGDMVPDPRRFGVLYMSRKEISGLFDMDGAFNDVALQLLRGASTASVVDALDVILKPYGGQGAYLRDRQVSHTFLDNELIQLRAMASVIPPIFLFVAAFLVNMILSRLIALEREQIGLLKAVGYGNAAIVWHYAKLTIVIAILGVAIGAAAGNWAGRGLTRLYAEFYSFPVLVFAESVDLYVISAAIAVAAALAGAAKAIAGVVVLPAAVAMQAPAPVRYRSVFGFGQTITRHFSQMTVMAFRQIIRRPLRALLTTVGASFSVALLVTALFSFDSINFMIDAVFFQVERQDATLSFDRNRGPAALQSVAALPGVMRAEPFRAEPAVLASGHREKRLSITGLPDGTDLARIVDLDLHPLDPPASGLMISDRIARYLKVGMGDRIRVDLVDRDHKRVDVTVTGIVESYVGLVAYMRLDELDHLAGDGARLTGVRISVDRTRLDALYRKLKAIPAIGAVALQGVSRDNFRKTIAENITIMTTVYTILAVIITFGLIYNSARIQLSERARELASLRVLGFTRAEVSSVLLIELAVIIAFAQPLGWLFGWLFSWSVVEGFDSDLFRIPFVINVSTFAVASLVVIVAAALSALVVRRRVDRLDLVRVLKTRE